MFNLLGEISLSLATDKRVYQVGDTPSYILQAGIPGSEVYWTSFKNGVWTGEDNAGYAQTIGANGTVELPAGGPWTDSDVGRWTKQARVIDPDGNTKLLQVSFDVVPAASSTAPSAAAPSNDLFSGETSIFGTTIPLPPIVVYGVGGYLGWQILQSFGKRR